MSIGKVLLSGAIVSLAFLQPALVLSQTEGTIEARGRYLIVIGGCNDCHTAGFGPSGGATPESEWLLGDSIGYRGPWGTTYAANLRTYMGNITEDQWVAVAQALRTRPPMPWWAVNAVAADDLRSMYRYIRSLDLVESLVPAYVPPDRTPSTPYIQWPAAPE